TGAVADVLAKWMKGRREVPSLHLLKDYWQSDAWQQAIADSIQVFRAEHGTADKLLFSFHGIPQSYEKKGDRYGERCLHSSQQIAARLGLDVYQWQENFQTLYGLQPWLP